MSEKFSKATFLFALVTSVLSLSGCLPSGDSTATANSPPPSGNNNAPIISGSPVPVVVAGTAFSFRPVASDPDGDTLTFSIVNRPDWMAFATSTGSMKGTPAAKDVRNYTNIVVSVSDGQVSTSLPAFDISVTQSADGSVTLTWAPPVQNSDGSPLTDLAGYRIYYGTQPGDYSEVIQIDNPGISTYVVENLPPAVYFFSSTAFNDHLVESDYSNEASRQIL